MATIDTLITWNESTGIRMLRDRKDVINAATLASYTRTRMYSGRNMEEFFRHGNRIRDRIFLRPEDLFRRIDPDDETTYSRTSPGKDWEIPYSIGYTHVVFNEFELDLNASQMKEEHLAHIFKDVWTQKWQNMYTGLFNTLDFEDWAVPDRTLMEVTTSNSKAPYSWQAIGPNEYFLGLPGNESDGAGGSTGMPGHPGGAWTTIQGIDPGTTATARAETLGNWDTQRISYSFAHSGASSPNTTEMLNGMSKLYQHCGFDSLPMQAQFSDPRTAPNFIATQLEGIVNYEDALRSNQDFFRGYASGQDAAYPGPTFMGVAMQRLSTLETAAIFPTNGIGGSAGGLGLYNDTTNDGADTDMLTVESGRDRYATSPITTLFGKSGPRYKFLHLGSLVCLWHANHYIRPGSRWVQPSNRYFERVKVVTVMNNNIVRNRRVQGELFPFGGGGVGATVESA